MKSKVKKEVTEGMLITATKLVDAATRVLGRRLTDAQAADLLADNTKWRSDTIAEVVKVLNLSGDANKKLIGTVDITPPWRDVMPILLNAIEHGTSKAKEDAMTELSRMAKLADMYVASTKAVKKRVKFIAIGSNNCWGQGFDIEQAKQAMIKAGSRHKRAIRWTVFQCTIGTYVNDTGGLSRPATDPEAILVASNIAGEVIMPVERGDDGDA